MQSKSLTDITASELDLSSSFVSRQVLAKVPMIAFWDAP